MKEVEVPNGKIQIGIHQNISQSQQPQPQIRYKIFDLYWLRHPNLGNKDIHEKCADIVVISFNITFGNLRIVFYKTNENTFVNSSILMKNLTRIANCTLYPVALNELLFYKDKKNRSIISFDQIVGEGGDWVEKLPTSEIQIITVGKKQVIRLVISSENGDFFYDFINEQRVALLNAAEFCLKKGPELTGHNILLSQNLYELLDNYSLLLRQQNRLVEEDDYVL